MIAIGNFFFKYRNFVFPIFALTIFIPSSKIFTAAVFGPNYYMYPLILGLIIAFSGQVIRAATIGLKYITRGGKNKKVYAEDLATQGIFHHCRNPLYVGNILMLTGVGLISNSLIFMIIFVPLFSYIYQCIVLAEENYLRSKFGDEYELYCKKANRWIPKLNGLSKTFNSMKFNWWFYVTNEYNTVFNLFISIGIVSIIFVEPLANMAQQDKLKFGLIYFFFFLFIYLFIRILDKRNKPA